MWNATEPSTSLPCPSDPESESPPVCVPSLLLASLLCPSVCLHLSAACFSAWAFPGRRESSLPVSFLAFSLSCSFPGWRKETEEGALFEGMMGLCGMRAPLRALSLSGGSYPPGKREGSDKKNEGESKRTTKRPMNLKRVSLSFCGVAKALQ